jgi:hypothetical protein
MDVQVGGAVCVQRRPRMGPAARGRCCLA